MKKIITIVSLVCIANTAFAFDTTKLELTMTAKMFAGLVFHCQDEPEKAKELSKRLFSDYFGKQSQELQEFAKQKYIEQIDTLKLTATPIGCEEFKNRLKKGVRK